MSNAVVQRIAIAATQTVTGMVTNAADNPNQSTRWPVNGGPSS